MQGQVDGLLEGRDGAVVLFGSHGLLPIKIMQQYCLHSDVFCTQRLPCCFMMSSVQKSSLYEQAAGFCGCKSVYFA